jgi:hypothetical protein
MEAGLGTVHWLHGLEDYFEFTKDTESNQFVKFLLKLLYADNPTIKTTDDSSMEEFVYTLRKFAHSDILDILYKYYREGHDPLALQDAFSRGQVQSKVWLVRELAKIKTDFDMVFVLAGWFGQLTHYFDAGGINYAKARIMDIDPAACEISDKVFNASRLTDYKVKSIEYDITDPVKLYHSGLEYEVKNYQTGSNFTEKTIPDLVINTSAEHFSEDWFHKFVVKNFNTDPLYVIQSNNLFDVPEHVNCVHSVDHMEKKFPMTRLEYSGEIQLKGYKRFMLIGRP